MPRPPPCRLLPAQRDIVARTQCWQVALNLLDHFGVARLKALPRRVYSTVEFETELSEACLQAGPLAVVHHDVGDGHGVNNTASNATPIETAPNPVNPRPAN